MEWLDLEDGRFWKSLLIIGILLNIIALTTSDLGLDTQVRMAADEEGFLPWGHTRPNDPTASDPNDEGKISSPINLSESMVRLEAAVLMGALIGIASMFSIRLAALVSIYPTFIFSTGRGYQEVQIALLTTIGIILLCYSFENTGERKRLIERWNLNGKPMNPLHAIIGGIALSSILLMKGVISTEMTFLLGTIIGISFYLLFKSDTKLIGQMNIFYIASSVTIILIIAGWLGYGGTLSVIEYAPGRYLSAWLFAILGVLIIHTMFGMMIWPFIPDFWKRIKNITDVNAKVHLLLMVTITSALICYVAALWTYESLLWESDWPWVIWKMGNNGRYISMLMIPWFILLLRLKTTDQNMPTLDHPREITKGLLLAIILIIPLSLLTAVHGQTMWTDEAANQMDLTEGDDFLFVSDGDLGMHWLYTFHAPLDADKNNITGYWRSNNHDWTSDLDGELNHVNTIVLAPEVDNDVEGWTLYSSGEADFLNGGGMWKVMKRS